MRGSPSSQSSEPAAIRMLRKFGQRRTLVGIVAALSSILLIGALPAWNGKIWFTIANLTVISLLLGTVLLFALVAGLLALMSLWSFSRKIRRPETGSENSSSAYTVKYLIIPKRKYRLVVPLQKLIDPLSPPPPQPPQPPKNPYALADIQSFILPKEGEAREKCQDRFDCNTNLRRFAVADGVSQSFVPGEWAQIIATGYVNHPREFVNATDFANWLLYCSEDWRKWVEDEWMKRAIRKRQEERSGLYDEKEEARREQIWREDIKASKRSGAQATLIGCVLEPHMAARNGLVDVHVFSVGDANFFLFRQVNAESWIYEAFPNTSPGEFTSKPFTLSTLRDQMIQAWSWKKTETFKAHLGDYIVLASDALAKWLLTYIREKGVHDVLPFIMNTDHDLFKTLVDKERKERRLEDDDVTMLVIPIQAALRPR